MAAVMAAANSSFHVLAVDDSLLDRKLIERLLKTSAFQVTTVDSGSKALEFLGRLRSNPPLLSPEKQGPGVNLIITDYCMPGMTGYDLLKEVKGSSSLKDIPVVIMSSENEPSRINRCLEEGAEEFFLKPVRLSDMKKLTPHILKGRTTTTASTKEAATPAVNGGDHHHQQQLQQPLVVLQDEKKTSSSSICNKKRKLPADAGASPERDSGDAVQAALRQRRGVSVVDHQY